VVRPGTIFALYKTKKRYQLHLLDTLAKEVKSVQDFQLSLANRPDAMGVYPLQGPNHWLIIFFVNYEKPQAFRISRNKISRLKPEQFRPAGTSLTPAMVVGLASQDHPAIMVCEGKIARIYRWADERFTPIRQLNTESETAQLKAGFQIPGPDNISETVLYDDTNQDLYWFPAHKNKPSRLVHIDNGPRNVLGISPLRFDQQVGFLLLSRMEIQYHFQHRPSLTLAKVAEYASAAENHLPWRIKQVVLGTPPKKRLALLDARNRSIELVSYEANTLQGDLTFEVFQEPGFPTGSPKSIYEPRDIAGGDFNGDGIHDLAILVHDKLILYLGE
jgi:hypothetical protein